MLPGRREQGREGRAHVEAIGWNSQHDASDLAFRGVRALHGAFQYQSDEIRPAIHARSATRYCRVLFFKTRPDVLGVCNIHDHDENTFRRAREEACNSCREISLSPERRHFEELHLSRSLPNHGRNHAIVFLGCIVTARIVNARQPMQISPAAGVRHQQTGVLRNSRLEEISKIHAFTPQQLLAAQICWETVQAHDDALWCRQVQKPHEAIRFDPPAEESNGEGHSRPLVPLRAKSTCETLQGLLEPRNTE
mmetsp:Transcript_629/g.2341  ORF Transcript_629/g.2341 Transcript_629/m.2341 type:complete len:251 (-) Transcript_629:11552-12304(-)